MSRIAHDFKHGKFLKMGGFCIIGKNVVVGHNVDIQHFVLLKEGTRIGNNCYIDSFVRSSGNNKIGNNVTIRFGATIGRGCTIEDDVFISPNVMTTLRKTHKGTTIEGTVIGKGCFIGTNAVIGFGIKICPNVVIGAMSLVTKNITKQGIYHGIPAKFIREREIGETGA